MATTRSRASSKPNPRNLRARYAAGLTRVRIAGGMGRKHGREHFLAVGSVKEAVDLIEARSPGFKREIAERGDSYVYRVQVGREDLKATVGDARELTRPTRGKTITITPVAAGSSGSKGVFQVIAGVVILAATAVADYYTGGAFSAATGGVGYSLGIGLLFGGVASLIAGTPKQSSAGEGKALKGSTRFNGPANLAGQGTAIPIAYGRPWTGAVIVDNGIRSVDVQAEKERDDATITSPTVTYSDRNGAAFHAVGGGGGGSSSGSSSGAKEDKDTAFSRQYSNVLAVLSQGPCDGIEGELQGVALDGTPMQNPDGTGNFRNFKLDFRAGTQTQDAIPGFDAQEATFPEAVQLKQQTPYVRHIADTSLDALRIDVFYPDLSKTNTKNGNVTGTEVKIAIDVSQNGGAWQTLVDPEGSGRLKEKTKQYTRSYEIQLPRPGPWDVRVRRVTADSNSRFLQNITQITARTEITYVKLTHPNICKLGLQIDSEQFSSIPNIAVRLRGRIVLVPSNYDPITRTYTGLPDGTFKSAWTDNPVWCWRDLLTNTRYGAGQILNGKLPSFGELYTCSQFCDQLVPDNNGGMEPRFTCNWWIHEQDQALKVIADLASTFRAMVYYRAGLVEVAQDRPFDFIRAQFGPSNVLNGSFSYAGTADAARHNLINVEWEDPANFGQPDYVETEDAESIAQEGRIKLDKVTAVGCTSRGQAWRTGEFHRVTGQLETDTVTFRTGPDGGHLKPGQVISIQNPFRSGSKNQGRVAGGDNTAIVLDRPITLDTSAGDSSFKIAVVLTGSDDDGKPVKQVVTRALVEQTSGTYQIVHAVDPFPTAPARQSQFAIHSAKLQKDLYRVMSVSHEGGVTWEIAALTYNASKYDAIELGTRLKVPPTSIQPDPFVCLPPGAVTVRQTSEVLADGSTSAKVIAEWQPSAEPFLAGYRVRVRVDGASYTTVAQLTADTTAAVALGNGQEFEFQVYALNRAGAISAAATASYQATVATLADVQVRGLALTGRSDGAIFGGRDAHLRCRVTSPSLAAAQQSLTDPGYVVGGVTQEPAFAAMLWSFHPADADEGQEAFWSARVAKQVGGEQTYTFTYEQNGESTGRARRRFRVEARAISADGQVSAPGKITVENPQDGPVAAAYANPSLTDAVLTVSDPGGLDHAGYYVLKSLDPACAIGAAGTQGRAYGASRTIPIEQAPGSTIYVRVASYDEFTDLSAPNVVDDLSFSAPLAATADFITRAHFTEELRTNLNFYDAVGADVRSVTTKGYSSLSAFVDVANIQFAVVGQNSASIATLFSTSVDQSAALAQAKTDLRAEFNGNLANAVSTLRAESAATYATASSVTALAASIPGSIAGAIQSLRVEVSQTYATASSVTSLSASIPGSIAAQINQNNLAYVLPNFAQASSFNSFVASVPGSIATAINNYDATATPGSATVTNLTQLSTTLNGHTNTLTTYGTSIDGLKAQYVIQLDTDGQTAVSFKLAGGGGALSSVKFRADKFVVNKPDGTLAFRSGTDAFVLGQPINSNGFNSGAAGWSITLDGNAEFNHVSQRTP